MRIPNEKSTIKEIKQWISYETRENVRPIVEHYVRRRKAGMKADTTTEKWIGKLQQASEGKSRVTFDVKVGNRRTKKELLAQVNTIQKFKQSVVRRTFRNEKTQEAYQNAKSIGIKTGNRLSRFNFVKQIVDDVAFDDPDKEEAYQRFNTKYPNNQVSREKYNKMIGEEYEDARKEKAYQSFISTHEYITRKEYDMLIDAFNGLEDKLKSYGYEYYMHENAETEQSARSKAKENNETIVGNLLSMINVKSTKELIMDSEMAAYVTYAKGLNTEQAFKLFTQIAEGEISYDEALEGIEGVL